MDEELAGQQSVDVRQFGAKGDGATDDSAAFQAAVDSLESTGGIVRVPPGGVHAIGSKVTIRSRQPVWIKSAMAGNGLDGAAALTHADRAQFRPLNNIQCMFEWDCAQRDERIEAGGGGVQGLHFADRVTVKGTPAADPPKKLTAAVRMKYAGPFHVYDCSFAV